MKIRKNIDKQKLIKSEWSEIVFPDTAPKMELWDYEFCKALYSLVQLLEEVDLDDDE